MEIPTWDAAHGEMVALPTLEMLCAAPIASHWTLVKHLKKKKKKLRQCTWRAHLGPLIYLLLLLFHIYSLILSYKFFSVFLFGVISFEM